MGKGAVKAKLAQSFRELGESKIAFSSAVSATFGSNITAFVYVDGEDVRVVANAPSNQQNWTNFLAHKCTNSRGVAVAKALEASGKDLVKVAFLDDNTRTVFIYDLVHEPSQNPPFTIRNELKCPVTEVGGNDANRLLSFEFVLNQNESDRYIFHFHQTNDYQRSYLAVRRPSNEWDRHADIIDDWVAKESTYLQMCTPGFPYSTDARGNFNFIRLNHRKEGENAPGYIELKTISGFDGSVDQSDLIRTPNTESYNLDMRYVSRCFLGKNYPLAHVFGVDERRGGIHWLAQTDSVISRDIRPSFAPWRYVQTTPGKESAIKFLTCEPSILDDDIIILFCRSEDNHCYTVRYNEDFSGRWEFAFPHTDLGGTVEEIITGNTSDGRPQAFIRGKKDGTEDYTLFRLYLSDSGWQHEEVNW